MKIIRFRNPILINPLFKMRLHYYWIHKMKKEKIKCTGRNAILINVVFLLMFFLINIPAFADEVTLAWDPNEEPEVTGYNIYYKNHLNESYDKVRVHEIYEQDFDNPLFPEITIYNLNPSLVYYFVATATDGVNESDYSNEVMWPEKLTQPGPAEKGSGGGKSGGGPPCFIGTLNNLQ